MTSSLPPEQEGVYSLQIQPVTDTGFSMSPSNAVNLDKGDTATIKYSCSDSSKESITIAFGYQVPSPGDWYLNLYVNPGTWQVTKIDGTNYSDVKKGDFLTDNQVITFDH